VNAIINDLHIENTTESQITGRTPDARADITMGMMMMMMMML